MELANKKINNMKELHEGLDEREARRRLEEYGPNLIDSKKRISPFKILLSQFTDFMVLVLLASTAVSAVMGEVTEAITIIAIVIINAVLGFIQEYKTERTLEALRNLAAPTARVIRGGNMITVPAEEIVPGDVIKLDAGDRIPADAVLISSFNLHVDESILTGESVPAEKIPISGKGFSDRVRSVSKVHMGTVVTSGRAEAFVYSTGMDTEMGMIAGMIQEIEEEQTPLQKRLERLGKIIVAACLVICAVVSVTGVLRGYDIFAMLLSGISLAVAAVPEGLPAIVTIALALGVQRMLKRNALVRKLPAVETLGCASVICSDKTGTLTENKMTVRKIFAADQLLEVGGSGYETKGAFTCKGRKVDPLAVKPFRLLLEIGGVCNNSTISGLEHIKKGLFGKVAGLKDGKGIKVMGDPTEGALLIAAAKADLTPDMLSRMYRKTDELPFDSDRKCMSVVCAVENGETFVFTKGAPDVLIKKCRKIMTAKGCSEMTPALRASILDINDSLASEALRVLGFAYKNIPAGRYNRDELEEELIFVGLAGMIDPPRPEAREAVRKCRQAGIKPVMITGDHKITAAAIAKELEIADENSRILTGAELDIMNEKDILNTAEKVSVYARVSPKHKLTIVRTLKKLGHIVAMTGDGVNDAPAIKEADIGVSMGITGTDVTKEASSIILLDDNFATIVAAVEEGRVIYSNIRKFIRYLLSCNIGEVLTMFLGTLIGLPLPLLPIQVLWVNLVTDGLPAIALGLEPAEKDTMLRAPRSTKDNIFSDGLLFLILLRGVLLGLSTLAVFASTLYFTGNLALARTAGFVTLVLTQLTHVFECKSERKTIFQIRFFNNKYLLLAVLCSLIMILSAVYMPFLSNIFKTVPLTMNEWLIIAGFTALGPVVSSILRTARR